MGYLQATPLKINLFPLISLFLSLFLTSCGGGGSGGDSTPPVVTVPANISVEAESSSGAPVSNTEITTFLSSSTALDAVDESNLTFSHDAPSILPLGATTVTFSYLDTSGNTGRGSAIVTVVDTTSPIVTAPSNLIVEGPGTAEIDTFLNDATVIDIADPSPVLSHDAPAQFPLGDTLVAFTFTDASGNTGSASATVTITDSTNPVVTAPSDIIIEAESAAGTPATNTTITSFLLDSSATDNVDSAPVLSHDSPVTFPLGDTAVTFTYTDEAGNSSASSALVTVRDTTPPEIALTGDNPLLVYLHSSFSEPGSSVTDAVDTSLTATIMGSVDTALVGLYILSYDVTDTAGNIATTVTRTVNVEVAEPSNVGYTVSPKHLNFTWDASAAQDKFRISSNPDGASGFSVVATASNIATSATGYSLEIPVHLTDWHNGQFIVEACNTDESQCKSSPNQTIAQTDSIPAIFYIKASNPDDSDYFGNSIALSADGTTMAVGAWEDSSATGINGDQSDNSSIQSGAVYLFIKTGNTWAQQAYVKASNTSSNDYFGWSVSLSEDGNTLAVGASSEDTLIGGSGAAYVFTRTNSVWSQQALIKASNPGGSDKFGFSVSLSNNGNTLAVGAPYEDCNSTGINGDESNNSATSSGAAYVFTRTDSVWSQQAYVKASNTGSNDWFGYSLSLSGDGNTLAVGAAAEESNSTGINGEESNNSATNSGAAYVFTRTDSVWSQQAYIKASNTDSSDSFGFSTSLNFDGNTLAVAAHGEDSQATGINGDQSDNIAGGSGAVYVFSRSIQIWSQQAYVKASNTDQGDQFGVSTALSGDGNTLAVSASSENSSATGVGGDQSYGGITSFATYAFVRTGSSWSQESYVKTSNAEHGDQGNRNNLSISGDAQTLAISSNNEKSTATGVGGDQTDNSGANVGAVYLY